MGRVMGAAVGDMLRALHESHGVIFHLGATLAAISEDAVTLSTGQRLCADVVVVGIGLRPEVALARQAGLTIDRCVVVDDLLRTRAPGIHAVGDIARWPDRGAGGPIRVGHWLVAERQGQVVARYMLSRRQPFDTVAFFWSQHFDIAISYVGHAEQWDRLDVDGDPAAHDRVISFLQGGKKLAVATVGRDLDRLGAELALEQEAAARRCTGLPPDISD